jgi:hypothetical protein
MHEGAALAPDAQGGARYAAFSVFGKADCHKQKFTRQDGTEKLAESDFAQGKLCFACGDEHSQYQGYAGRYRIIGKMAREPDKIL